MSMSSNKPVKILCLHGLGQTGEQMLKSLEPLIKSLPSDWEFVAPDAPNAMPGLRDFAYMGTQGQVSNLTTSQSQSTTKAQAPAPSATPDKEAQKILSSAVQAVSIQIAAQSEIDADAQRPSQWSEGKWSETMKGYLNSSQPLINNSPEIKKAYEEELRKGNGKVKNVESFMNQLEKMAGRKRKFPRTYSMQGESWKAKGEWIGYGISFVMLAELMNEQGPFQGCIGFSAGAQFGWCVQSLLTHTGSLSGNPSFAPFPASQPPFSFILSYSGIEVTEKNTSRWIRSFPPISSTSPQLLTSLKPNPKILGNFDRLPKQMEVHSFSTWGAKDSAIPTFLMASLANTVKSEFNTVHPGNHEVYLKGEWMELSSDWLKAVNGVGEKSLKQVMGKLPGDSLPLDTGVPKKKEKVEGGPGGKGRL